ncbi:MAG: DUF2917 domain-containing protein [Rhodocyclaceae bacterium]|nr:DUF2917 domain-containing protein [Rhodocyclaceae bacterium]
MIRITQETRLELDKRELVAICGRGPLRLECAAGELWLTREGSTADVVLRAGESLAIDARQETVISALQPARLSLVPQRQSDDVRIRIRIQGEAQERLARLSRWRFPPLASFPANLIL